jgi:hypothetical protein
MRRLVVVMVLLAAAIAVSVVLASSHREAPLTSIDPTADDTDLYAFTAPDATGALTVVSNWIPFEDPAGGPNFYGFDPKARYYINIDNTGDGKPEVRYRFAFRTRYANPDSFLYVAGVEGNPLPQVTYVDDPNLNIRQTYSIVREEYRNGRRTSTRTIRRGIRVAPNNVGPKTMPDYDRVWRGAITTLRGGAKVFAGPRDDPFFVDLGETFDTINFRVGTGNAGGGKDDLAGYGVHSIVMQIPEAQVTRDGRAVSAPDAANAVVGVWASTERRRFEVRSGRRPRGSNPWVQVSRLGNPLVNEVVIPIGKKDQFNRTTPDRDAALYGQYVVKPELARTFNALFPGVNAPEDDRTDIVLAVLQGVPGVNRQVAGDAAPAVDTLKLNLGTPPAASPNRFGVLANDVAGYPNGRRLTDDVVDIDLRVFAGFLKDNKVPLGDGVDQNDKAFLDAFPYLPPTDSGYDSRIKRTEPGHSPTPGQP